MLTMKHLHNRTTVAAAVVTLVLVTVGTILYSQGVLPLNLKRLSESDPKPTKKPLIDFNVTPAWPPAGTEIFWPTTSTANRSGSLYGDFSVVAITICCASGESIRFPKGAVVLNSRYFPRHGIPFIVFRECEGLYDWERLMRARQVMRRSEEIDFVVWMDCDAGVVVGKEDDNLIDPHDRFLRHFHLFDHPREQDKAVGMVLSRHVDFQGSPQFDHISNESKATYCDKQCVYFPDNIRGEITDCWVNSGVLVIRNSVEGHSVIDRMEQLMLWENVTTPVEHMQRTLPDSSQAAFNKAFQEQITVTGSKDHPIRLVDGRFFNRHVPPLAYDVGKEFSVEAYLSANAWETNTETFIVHTFGDHWRTRFWDCAASIPSRSAMFTIDVCGELLKEDYIYRH